MGRVGPQGQNSDRVGQVHLAAPVIQSSLQPKLYKCNSSRLHLPHQTDRQTDRQESRNPRCDEGFKVCSVSNRFSATLMDNPAGATARCRRQCGGVDGKFAFFPSSSKVAGTRKAGDRDSNRGGWIKKFINQKLSSGLCWVVGAAEKKKSQLP